MNNAPPLITDPQDPCSPFSVSAKKTALLLLDFHKFIVASQPGAGQGPLEKAVLLRKWARAQGIIIVHCLIDLKATTAPNRKMAKRANGVRDEKGSARDECGEHAAVAASADEFTFWRPPSHVSALGSYGLHAFLEQHAITSLLLAGFSTSGCVINTAKSATDQGFIVTVIKDACGDKAQDVHDMITTKLLVGQTHVSDEKTFVDAWPNTAVHDLCDATAKVSIQ